MRHRGFFALASTLVACAAVASAGCFGMPAERSAAATVNGEPVYEDEVTDYIEGFRSKNDEYGTDAGWADYLAGYGSAEGLRAEVLETVFIPKVLVRQECAVRNISVTDSDLDAVIAEERAYYEARYGADSWDSVLASYGYDEDSWRANEEDRLLEDELAQTVVEDKTPGRSEVQAQANAHASDYNGRHSYYIAFPTRQSALDARSQLAMRSDGTTTLKRFKKLGHALDAGWSSLPGARGDLTPAYLGALDGLAVHGVSAPVSDGGDYLLVFCNGVFNVDADAPFVKLSSIPEPIYDQIVSDAREQLVETRFEAWLDDVEEHSDIVVNPMPSGLSYDVDAPMADNREGR